MTDFDQFDRVNVADAPEHAATAQAELAAARALQPHGSVGSNSGGLEVAASDGIGQLAKVNATHQS